MARVRYRGRKTFRVGPLYAIVTPRSIRAALDALLGRAGLVAALRALFTSYGTKTGPVTRNMARGTTSIDTPGPGGVVIEPDRPKRRRRKGRRS